MMASSSWKVAARAPVVAAATHRATTLRASPAVAPQRRMRADDAAAATATASLAASLADAFPTARVRHSGAAAAAAATRTPWHLYTVEQLLQHKAGRAKPAAERELSQRAGVAELREGDTVARAVALMQETGVGSVLVNNGPILAGIVTLLDVIRRVLVPRRDPAATALREILSAHVTCATEAYTLDQCMATLENGRFRHVPVYRDLSGGGQAGQNFDEDPRLVGVVSLTDMTFFMAKYLLDHDDLGSTPVRALLPATNASPPAALTIAETGSCADAMTKLVQSGRGIVVITRGGRGTDGDGGTPVGVLTERNVIRHAFSAGPYFRDTSVSAMSSDPLPVVEPGLPLAQLAALQAARALNQVPVVEKDAYANSNSNLRLRHILSTAEVLRFVRARVAAGGN